MLFSSIRKRTISGWLAHNYLEEFSSLFKLQTFLFFYEAISKIENNDAEFYSLKGNVNGTYFSDVQKDYTSHKDEFVQNAKEAYTLSKELVNENIAMFSGFLVKILNEKELSKLTHELNIWKRKGKEIQSEGINISLSEQDLDEDDQEFLLSLRSMYTTEYVESVQVMGINGKSFILNKDDVHKITHEQERLLINLSDDDNIGNPLYVSISEDGLVLVDW